MNRIVVAFDGFEKEVSANEIRALRKLFPIFKNLSPAVVKAELTKYDPYVIGLFSEEEITALKRKASEYEIKLLYRPESDYGSKLILEECKCHIDSNATKYNILVFMPSFNPECVLMYQRIGETWHAYFATMQASIYQKFFIPSSLSSPEELSYSLYQDEVVLGINQSKKIDELTSNLSAKNFENDKRIGCDGIDIYINELNEQFPSSACCWSPSKSETPIQYSYVFRFIAEFLEVSNNRTSIKYLKMLQSYIN